VFLAQLTDPEKRAFLKLARDLVALNGVVAEETEMLASACREMGVPPEAGLALSFDEACRAFGSERSRKIAVLELMMLAKADGLVQREENALIVEVSRVFDLPDESAAWSRRWAELVLELYRSGVRYLDAAEHAPLSAVR
jgi:hypothetical protein